MKPLRLDDSIFNITWQQSGVFRTIFSPHMVDVMDMEGLDISPEAYIKPFTNFIKPQYAPTHDFAPSKEVFKIRHNVYCEELAFEDEKDNGIELNEFALHFLLGLIHHKHTCNCAGSVRPVNSNCICELILIEILCYDAIQNKDYDPKSFKRSKICEMSRLVVKLEFRHFNSIRFKAFAIRANSESNYSEAELSCFSLIHISLYMIACILLANKVIKHALIIIEPGLARSMTNFSIESVQFGEPIEYH